MPPSDPLPALLAEHRHLLAAIDGNDRQLLEPRPDSFAALAARRWTFARELLQHCAHEETAVLRPLMQDRRPAVAAEAARLLAEQNQIVADYKEHVRRWGAFASAAEWPDYVRSARGLMQRVRRRIHAEESGLYLHLPVQRTTDAPPGPTQHHADLSTARQIHALIFQGKPLP